MAEGSKSFISSFFGSGRFFKNFLSAVSVSTGKLVKEKFERCDL